MTFEEEWEILKNKSMNERLAIYDKYPTPKNQLDYCAELTIELKEESKRFFAELAELRKKYGR